MQTDTSPAEPVEPVKMQQRLAVIDALRGFALLGILMVNIESFGLSEAAMFNPTIDGGFAGATLATWIVNHIFFEEKMMTIFSLLFGAGILLFAERAEVRGRRAIGLHYRRMAWLLIIGLLHAYILWSGDILAAYAVCGMLVYALRRRTAALLIPLGIAIMLITTAIYACIGIGTAMLREAALDAEARQAAGESLSAGEEEMITAWQEARATFEPTDDAMAEERSQYLSGYSKFWPYLAGSSLMVQTKVFAMYILWRASGLMLIGMALLKLRVLSGQRSRRFYGWLAGLGLGVGLPIVAGGAALRAATDFDWVFYFCCGAHFNYVGSFLVALGYIGLIVGCWKAGIALALWERLAAVGRMALTNYLMHSLLCAMLFFGWGFGWFGSLDRFELRGVVVTIWLLQLAVSPIWLRHFRFGPIEWVWRTLTYWKLQPM